MEDEMNSEEIQIFKDQEAFIEKYSQREESKNKETEDSHSGEPSGHGAKHSKRSKGLKLTKKRKEKEEVSESIDEGKRKPSRAESWVWQHFTQIKNRDPNWPRAACNWCGVDYACHKKRNGTKNMAVHLEEKCPKFPRKLLDCKQTILSFQPRRKEEGEGGGSNLTAISFDIDACRQALARMIIVDELPFKHVEGEGFRYFMSVVQPLFPIPSSITMARDCYKLFMLEKKRLKAVLGGGTQSVCLTTDCWTSIQNLNYLCLTAHFIDSDWKLHKRILNFCQIASHKGEVIGQKIEKCLAEWGIERVFTITVDNASSNDVAIAYLKRQINDWNGSVMQGEYMHVRCCAHILNLVVNDGLKDMHESILRIRNAVRYVRASPARLQKFKKYAELSKIQEKSMVQLDVPTRWNSTYLMLERAVKFQKAFMKMAERDAQFIIESVISPPTSEDWDNARHFVKFLKIFYDATLNVSGSLFVTSSNYFHEFCLIMNTLKSWCESEDIQLKSMAEKMKAKHDKYWGNLKNMNMLIFIAAVLDPRYKMKFVEWSFGKIFDKEVAKSMIEKVKEVINNMYGRYKNFYSNVDKSQIVGEPSVSNLLVDEGSMNGKNSFLMEFDMDMSRDDSLDNKSELEQYFLEAREKNMPKFDILCWWKVNSTRFPVLAQIARGVLAVPMSTVASESAFSTGGRVLDQYRSSLTPRTVEALICSQNWFRSSPLSLDMEEAVDDFEKVEIDELGPLDVSDDEY